MDTFTYVDSKGRERHIAWLEGAPHIRYRNEWKSFVPAPPDLLHNGPLMEWLLQRARCENCTKRIDFITIFTGCTRATWPRYDTPRCRETAQKRRYRARAKENQ